MQDDINYIFQYLKSIKANLNKRDFKIDLISHPSYPSLIALSDTLNLYEIPNNVFRIENSLINDLPANFLGSLKRKNSSGFSFGYIEKKNNFFKIYTSENKNKASKKDFEALFDGLILIGENKNKNSIKNFFLKPYIFPFLLVLLALFFFFIKNNFFPSAIFIVLSLIGLLFSLSAFNKELGISDSLSKKICIKKENIDCDSVIGSQKKISFVNLSLSFFFSCIGAIFLFGIAEELKSLYYIALYIHYASLPLIIYSVFYQIYVERKLCLICISIAVIILIQLIVLFFLNTIKPYPTEQVHLSQCDSLTYFCCKQLLGYDKKGYSLTDA